MRVCVQYTIALISRDWKPRRARNSPESWEGIDFRQEFNSRWDASADGSLEFRSTCRSVRPTRINTPRLHDATLFPA